MPPRGHFNCVFFLFSCSSPPYVYLYIHFFGARANSHTHTHTLVCASSEHPGHCRSSIKNSNVNSYPGDTLICIVTCIAHCTHTYTYARVHNWIVIVRCVRCESSMKYGLWRISLDDWLARFPSNANSQFNVVVFRWLSEQLTRKTTTATPQQPVVMWFYYIESCVCLPNATQLGAKIFAPNIPMRCTSAVENCKMKDVTTPECGRNKRETKKDKNQWKRKEKEIVEFARL